jgi:MFS family permease
MLKRIGLSLTMVIAFSVISQFFNILFLQIWGSLTDRFSNKSVMQVSGGLLLISVIIWPFTTFPEVHVATLPLLALIHILLGIAMAGVSIASFNIAFKLAPPGDATKYLAVNGALVSLGMGIGPSTRSWGRLRYC